MAKSYAIGCYQGATFTGYVVDPQTQETERYTLADAQTMARRLNTKGDAKAVFAPVVFEG